MHGEYKVPGGKLVVVELEVHGRLHNVRISGDFFLEPPEALDAINHKLNGMPAESADEALAQAVLEALPSGTVMFGFSADAVAVVLKRALAS